MEYEYIYGLKSSLVTWYDIEMKAKVCKSCMATSSRPKKSFVHITMSTYLNTFENDHRGQGPCHSGKEYMQIIQNYLKDIDFLQLNVRIQSD